MPFVVAEVIGSFCRNFAISVTNFDNLRMISIFCQISMMHA